ncbi:biopolymer transporter ExbD [Opitutales bacterium ASA1]|jgi:biopolymer transport protein ExbD|uniref:ExbD/TolR family protein n=1 Tax=Congregicoccus parvus TaxID=3081749 RepID=UPI002B2F173D|nr:biopolymer transporter ExbD [Opitutales bacterium ASA1]
MRRKSRRRGEGADIDLTPMLDMTFIMLIFFIVTSSFVKETGIDVSRPSASTAERKERGSILIAIRENDEIWMEKQRIDVRAVRANVERMRAENPEASVVVIADKGSKNGILVQVLDQARLAGASNVSIAAENPGG